MCVYTRIRKLRIGFERRRTASVGKGTEEAEAARVADQERTGKAKRTEPQVCEIATAISQTWGSVRVAFPGRSWS
ncbi:MAG: hypothetical protein O7F72_06840, partial [Proteobacteria bacterium]|nr:hypothetical protein [Pseudomonadota bacterium]